MPELESGEANHNLPRRLTSFLGRDAETAAVRALLERHRVVTITGPGGAGKSRLALHLGEQAVSRHPEGVWWVDLTDLTQPSLLPARAALVAGLHINLGEDQRDEVTTRLAQRPVLLVLDNCEHLASDAAGFVRRLLGSGDQARVLLTSRRPIGLDGEVTWRIPPLALPPSDDAEPLSNEAALSRYASARLFLERARCGRPSFAVNEQAGAHVAQICRHVDGMPLALELAAARCRSLDVGRVRQELDKALDLLSNRQPGRSSRHQTMRASIAWSEGLLDHRQRVVFRRLAAFAGGFTLEDAQPVVSDTKLNGSRVVDAIDALVTHSLVAFVGASAAPARYRLQEVVRQYAGQRLRQAGEEQALLRRHAERYAELARELGHGLMTTWDDAAFARLAAERDNLEVALGTFCDDGRPARAAALLWDSQMMWGAVGPAAADLAMKRLLGRPEPMEPATLARLHTARAVVQADAGAVLPALESAAAALPLAQASGDWLALARARVYHAALLAPADPVAAEPALAAAVEQSVEVGDGLGAAFGRFWLSACITVFQGDLSRGMPAVADQLHHESTAGHPAQIAGFHCVLAEAHVEQGDVAAALEHARATDELLGRVAALLPSGAARFRSLSVPGSVATLVLGYASILRNDPPLAGRDLAAASGRSAADGYPFAAYFYRLLNGLDHLRLRDPTGAMKEFAVAEGLAAQVGGWFTANTRLVGAMAAITAGEHQAAAQWLNHVSAAELPTPLLRARLRVVQANLALLQGQPASAEEFAHRGLKAAAAQEITFETAQLLELLARVAAASSNWVEVGRLGGAANRLRTTKGLAFGPPGHLDPVLDDLMAARTALGEACYARAWAEGQSLTPTEAVAYACRARGRRRRPSFGWDSLTPTEREVVDLVASGMTNPQVAARLLMSRETVKTHLRHVFHKLDLQNRAQVAAAAAKRAVR